jgi:endonuclease/exonuclease/phosphatase family metal-dependent hydrolase
MKISVLQWNVLFKEKADNILEFIQSTDADIVCLQELTQDSEANPKRDIPKEISELGYESFYVRTIDKPDWIMGNGIFSKLPIHASRQVFLRHELPNFQGASNESRAYLECTFNYNGRPLVVGTAHLSFAPGFTFSPEKEQEAEFFKQVLAKNSEHFVFTGDFNALPDSGLIQTLTKTYQHAGPDFTEATWTTKPFDYEGFQAKDLNWRLDYAFATPDVQVLSSEIIKTDYSDHLPILTKIKLQ